MPKGDLVRGIDLATPTATFTGAGAGAVGATGMEVHELDGPWHSGTLPWADIDTAGSSLADLATRPHSALTGITANDHHNQSHVLATTSGLGGDHTVSGLTAGYVLRASGASTAAFAAIQDADLPATIVRTSRVINSGAGLTGGGNLGADLTLNVGAGTLITVGADDVGITAGSAYQYIGTGSGTAAAWQNLSGLAGAGLAYASGVLSVNAGNGLLLSGDNVAVGVANTGATGLTVEADAVRLTSSSNPGAAASILASTASGGLTLKTLAVQGNVDITSGGDLTVGANILFVDVSQVSVGINGAPDPQFALDVYGPARAEYWIGPHALQIKNALLIAHFDGRQPFETNFTGETNGHMGQVATVAGGAIWREGKFNKALQVAEATTNLVTNPSFETGTTGWTYTDANASGTAAQTALYSHSGTYSVRLANANAAENDFYYCQVGSLSASTTYTISAWVNVVTFTAGAQSNLGLYAYDTLDAGATGQSTTITAATDGWVRHSVTVTTTATGGSHTIQIRLYAPQGYTAWDSVQLEQKAYATPYCDGSLGGFSAVGVADGTGHSWSGTAHASSSSRLVASASYPTSGNLPALKGSVMAWVKLSSLSGTAHVLRADGTSAGYIMLRFGTGQLTGYWGTAAVAYATPVSAETWTHVAMTYTGSLLTLYINGQSVASGSSTGFSGMPTLMYVGNTGGTGQINGLIDDLIITSDTKVADEILSIYESNAPVFAETAKYGFRATPKSLVWADDEGLWVRNTSGQAVMGVYAGEAATKSWGGVTMANADILIGDSSRNGYMLWDDSAGTLAMRDTTIEFYQSGTRFIRINSTNGIGIEGDQTGSESYNDYRSYSITSGGVAHGGLFGATNVASTWKRIYLLARGDTTYAPTLYLYSSRSAPGGTNSATTQVAALSENSSTADFGQALLTLTALSATSGGTADLTAAGGITMSASVGGITLAGSSAGVTATGGLYSSTVYGGKNANDDITIHGTSNATRTTSYVILQPTAGNVGIAQTTPTSVLHVTGTVSLDGSTVINDTGAAVGDFRVESDTEANFIWLDADGSTNGILYLGGSANRVQIEQGGVLSFQGTAKIKDGTNIPLDTTTGTKIGTGTTQKLAFWNATPIVRPSAFTQTYSTASKTHANLTYSAPAAYGAGANGYSTAAMASAVHAAVIALAADVANVKQVLNSVIDDLQSMGLLA